MPADVTANQPMIPATAPASAAADEASLGWTVRVVAVMVVLMALFNAASVISWANTLEPTPQNLQVKQAAQSWFDTTDKLGLAAPRAALRAQWAAARRVRFNGADDPTPAETPQR